MTSQTTSRLWSDPDKTKAGGGDPDIGDPSRRLLPVLPRSGPLSKHPRGANMNAPIISITTGNTSYRSYCCETKTDLALRAVAGVAVLAASIELTGVEKCLRAKCRLSCRSSGDLSRSGCFSAASNKSRRSCSHVRKPRASCSTGQRLSRAVVLRRRDPDGRSA